MGTVNPGISVGLLAPLRRNAGSDSGASTTHPVTTNQSADSRLKDSSRAHVTQTPIAGERPVNEKCYLVRHIVRRTNPHATHKSFQAREHRLFVAGAYPPRRMTGI